MRPGNRAGRSRREAFWVGIGLFFFIAGFGGGPAPVQALDAGLRVGPSYLLVIK